MRKGLLDALDLVFIPKQIASQVVLAVALETSLVRKWHISLQRPIWPMQWHSCSSTCILLIQVTVNQIWHIFRSIAASVSTHSRLIRQLHNQQRMAESQDEWMDLAEQIDNIQGHDIWRTERNCALYESERIQARIDELVRVPMWLNLIWFILYLGFCNLHGILHTAISRST